MAFVTGVVVEMVLSGRQLSTMIDLVRIEVDRHDHHHLRRDVTECLQGHTTPVYCAQQIAIILLATNVLNVLK